MKKKTPPRNGHDESPPAPDAAEETHAEVDALRAELANEKDRLLRSRAEFDNYKRRVEREKDGASQRAKREILHALIDLADDFDRALLHVDASPDSVATALHGMQRRLRKLLESEGVLPFESVGLPFDPARHEAIATVQDPGAAAGIVVDEAGRGYLWNGELLRPARVRVAQ